MRKKMSLVRKIMLSIGVGLFVLFISVIGLESFSGYGRCPQCHGPLQKSDMYICPEEYGYIVECPKCEWMTSVVKIKRKYESDSSKRKDKVRE